MGIHWRLDDEEVVGRSGGDDGSSIKEDCGSNGGDDGRVIASDSARTLAWNKKREEEKALEFLSHARRQHGHNSSKEEARSLRRQWFPW